MTTEWQPIETVPKDGRAVDLWWVAPPSWSRGRWEGRIADAWWGRNMWCSHDEGHEDGIFYAGEPKYWMIVEGPV